MSKKYLSVLFVYSLMLTACGKDTLPPAPERDPRYEIEGIWRSTCEVLGSDSSTDDTFEFKAEGEFTMVRRDYSDAGCDQLEIGGATAHEGKFAVVSAPEGPVLRIKTSTQWEWTFAKIIKDKGQLTMSRAERTPGARFDMSVQAVKIFKRVK